MNNMFGYDGAACDRQQSVATWVWGELLENALDATEPTNTQTWSEFEVTTPEGIRATVRIEVKV